MKLKRLASTVLSTVLGTIIVFSGCSNGNTEPGTASSIPNSSTASKAESKTESKVESKTESKVESKTESKAESSKNTEPDDDYTPAMWKVTKDDKEMYLFGSIHTTQDGAENLPDYVQKAFDECDYLAMEIDVDSVTNDLTKSFELMQELMYTDGTTIKDHISAETYDAAVELLTEKGMYVSYYDYFKPMMWISLLENAIRDVSGKSMESIMSAKAKEAGKEILEVESMEIQVSVFDKVSDKLADALIASYTADGAESQYSDSINALYEKWKHGEYIEDTDIDEVPEEYKSDYEAYNKAMLTDRNIGMADKAEEYMNDGKKVFFMVGAAHMYGDNGLVSLLTERGYTVERVYPTGETSKIAA